MHSWVHTTKVIYPVQVKGEQVAIVNKHGNPTPPSVVEALVGGSAASSRDMCGYTYCKGHNTSPPLGNNPSPLFYLPPSFTSSRAYFINGGSKKTFCVRLLTASVSCDVKPLTAADLGTSFSVSEHISRAFAWLETATVRFLSRNKRGRGQILW